MARGEQLGFVGGATLLGESDHLASQGSLVFSHHNQLLIAVDAGSETVSAFRVHGDRLDLESVVPSGGQFPASVGVHGDLAYVLNAGGTGIVQGFRLDPHGLTPIAGSARSLGLANSDPPNFLTSPGQVGFTPDGRQLLVTTKASTSSIDVFQVGHDGRLSATPVANPSATPVPFAFTFAPGGRLVSGEAGASSVTTYRINPAGTLEADLTVTKGEFVAVMGPSGHARPGWAAVAGGCGRGDDERRADRPRGLRRVPLRRDRDRRHRRRVPHRRGRLSEPDRKRHRPAPGPRGHRRLVVHARTGARRRWVPVRSAACRTTRLGSCELS